MPGMLTRNDFGAAPKPPPATAPPRGSHWWVFPGGNCLGDAIGQSQHGKTVDELKTICLN
eukprot:gene510-11860_t